jgi:hypothetical protein
MNNTEERIWNYIDGNCTLEEQQAIGLLIEQSEAWRSKYKELLLFNAGMQHLELEEPPMAFTYKVMETLRKQEAQQPLKAAINPKIIKLLAGLFILCIAVLLVPALATIKWTADFSFNRQFNAIQLPALKNVVNGPVIKGFIFFDVLIALALFDGYLRRLNGVKKV